MGPLKLSPVKGLVITAAVIFSAGIGGAGYAARYFFNERANVREKQEIIDQMKRKEERFVNYLTAEEMQAYKNLQEASSQRYVDELMRTTPINPPVSGTIPF